MRKWRHNVAVAYEDECSLFSQSCLADDEGYNSVLEIEKVTTLKDHIGKYDLSGSLKYRLSNRGKI